MGVWIRDRKWRQRSTGIKVVDPRQDCFFDPANEGLVNVEHKAVIDRLLAHPTDFEVAWDKLGVVFDEAGKVVNAPVSIRVIETDELTGALSGATSGELSDASAVIDGDVYTPKPKRGRPKKG